MEARFARNQESRATKSPTSTAALSDEQLAQLKAYYGFDKPWYAAYAQWLGQVVKGNLGESYRYNEPVLKLIAERLPVSAFYGLLTLIITYGLCVPLGVLQAIHYKKPLDTVSSGILLMGYAIPNYVLGSFLVVFLAARAGFFPTGGFVGPNFDELTFIGKIADLLHHAVLPLLCYLIGSFAFLTQVVKNSTLETLSADYMRSAAAKGTSSRYALFTHALRNSLIPLATNFGQNLTLFVSGSFLVETIFDIDGFGLLGYASTIDRDYPVVMGVLLIGALLLMVGNLISDLLVMAVDPRVRFDETKAKGGEGA